MNGHYDWEESESHIEMKIPLKGTKPAAVDIFATDIFIKVNYPPYLVLIDLHAPVDETKCRPRIKNGTLTIKVEKHNPAIWGILLAKGTKKELAARRQASIEAKSIRDEQLKEKQKDNKVATERSSLRKQMALEETERNAIEQKKTKEKEDAEAEVYKTFAEIEQKKAVAKEQKQAIKAPVVAETKSTPTEDDFDFSKYDDIDTDSESDMEADIENDDIDEEGEEENRANREAEEDVVYIPAPRTTAQVKFGFTPRLFPTPARESKQTEEGDWISKNRSHLKSHPHFNKNKKYFEQLVGDVTESDPTWLKGKGDDFYRSKDYMSAINAYSAALEVDPDLPNVLSNRAACYLCLGQLQKCIDDCTAALKKLPTQDEVPNLPSEQVKYTKLKIRLFIRRGTSSCQLAKYEAGLSDYNSALILDPKNQLLQFDVKRIAVLCRCASLKEEGDKSFAAQNLDQAIKHYSAALDLDSSFVSCLSNRAICYLAEGKHQKCIDDCSTALTLLEVSPDPNKLLPSGPMPPVGSGKRKQWVLKTLVRRGTAYSQVSQFKEAHADFQHASELDPENVALKEDVEQLAAAAAAAS